MVKVINIDPSGKVRLSRKALLTPEAGAVAGAPAGAAAGDAGGEAPRRPRPPLVNLAPSRSPRRPSHSSRRRAPAAASPPVSGPCRAGRPAPRGGAANHRRRLRTCRIDARLNDIIAITLTAGDTPHGMSLDDYRVAKRVEPDKPLRFDSAPTPPHVPLLLLSDQRRRACHDEHGELVARADGRPPRYPGRLATAPGSRAAVRPAARRKPNRALADARTARAPAAAADRRPDWSGPGGAST